MSVSAVGRKDRWPPKSACLSIVARRIQTRPAHHARAALWLAGLAVALLSLLVGPVSAQDVVKLRIEPVTVESQTKKEVFKAEIADTPETRQKGLMFRKQLASDEGMLFDFG